MSDVLKIAAVGDISFESLSDKPPSMEVLRAVVPVFLDADLVIANLENPLTGKKESVFGKCTLRGAPGWAQVLKDAGIHVLTLANNHMMDYGREGLSETRQVLNNLGLLHVGAGNNITQANAPIFIEKKGRRLAILARTSVHVASPSYAGPDIPGVAFFSLEEVRRTVQACRQKADIVILLMHWGLEEYRYPSISQRKLARELLQAGADIILGHHPHVLQGVEHINAKLVVYSLGNFVFDEIKWCFIGEEGDLHERIVPLTEENRKSGVLTVSIDESGVKAYDYLPTIIQKDGLLAVENTRARKKDFDRLSKMLAAPGYNVLWRLYAIGREWSLRIKPMIAGKLTWSKIKKIRPRHFSELFAKVAVAAKITSEKTTDPYSKKSS